jgi:hypothetical protein
MIVAGPNMFGKSTWIKKILFYKSQHQRKSYGFTNDGNPFMMN